MTDYRAFSRRELLAERKRLQKEFADYKACSLSLDMSRGNPGVEQLALSEPLLRMPSSDDCLAENGWDCRNYGGLGGLPEMKKIFAGLLEVEPDELIISENASLGLMFDNVSMNMSHGAREARPWQEQGQVKFLCPVPGYDRHFSICEYFGIQMISVEMSEDGPDMDAVEKWMSEDPMVKGMWCVPVFSNPGGIVYSDETVRRIARLKPAADDFRVYWDNAYCVHHFEGARPVIPNILRECEQAGNPDMPLVFASFSKITFPCASMAAVAASEANIAYIRKRLSLRSIGPDKLNQLRHARFFKDAEGVCRHMEKMGDLIRPKFQLVQSVLSKHLDGCGVAGWSRPRGGYFISFDAMDGCAKRIVELCGQAGVKMTPAGSTYPYRRDPRDRNIRIAPTFPAPEQLETALEIFCTAVRLASVESLLEGARMTEEPERYRRPKGPFSRSEKHDEGGNT